jgi:hypothetical protein
MLFERGWKHAILSVTLLATGLAVVPQSAIARDNCRNDSQYRGDRGARNRSNEGYYNSTAYRGRSDRYRGGYSSNDPYYGGNSTYRNDPYYDDRYYGYREPRSAGKSAAIVGGSAAAGAAVGAVTGGTKGAIIGGAVGAAGGLIYDRTTRNNPNRRW